MIEKLEIKTKNHEKLLLIQRIERFLETDLFEDAFNLVSQIGKNNIAKLVDNLQLYELKALCIKNVSQDLGEMSIRDLRDIARDLGIPYYSEYTKAELLSLIVSNKCNGSYEHEDQSHRSEKSFG